MDKNSVSNVSMILEINGEIRLNCELKRHLSPKTVGMITRSTPHIGNAYRLGNAAIYFETKVTSGSERVRTEFKKGDIAFLPNGNFICFFYTDSLHTKPMSPIGRVLENIDVLSKITNGQQIKFHSESF